MCIFIYKWPQIEIIVVTVYIIETFEVYTCVQRLYIYFSPPPPPATSIYIDIIAVCCIVCRLLTFLLVVAMRDHDNFF